MSGADAQLLAILMCYYRAKAHRVQSYTRITYDFVPWNEVTSLKPEIEWLTLRARLIESRRLIPVFLYPKDKKAVIRKNEVFLLPAKPPTYMDKVLKTYVDQTGDMNPVKSLEGLRISGSTVDGVANALGELARDAEPLTIEGKEFIHSLFIMHRIHGWHVRHKLKPPRFRPGCYTKITFPPRTGAGIDPHVETQIQLPGITLKITGHGKKNEMRVGAENRMDSINRNLRMLFRAGKRGYYPEVYAKLIISVEYKVELRKDDKTRIFFNMPLDWQLMVKHIFVRVFERRKHRGMNGIGLRWWGGDAQRLYAQFEHLKNLIESDLTRQDQTERAGLLAWHVLSNIIWFEEDDSEEFFILRHHIQKITEDSYVKIIQFPDDFWRVVTGMNSSGRYDTGMVNTEYCIAGLIEFLIHTHHNSSNPQYKRDSQIAINTWIQAVDASSPEAADAVIRESMLLAVFAGDDCVIGIDDRLISEFNFYTYREYMQTKRRLIIKLKNCNETDTMLSKFTLKDGKVEMRQWKPRDTDEVLDKAHGIQFLKHYFVLQKCPLDGGAYVVPFRDAADHWHRALRSTTNIEDKRIQLARLHGLMLGALGTNPALYNYHYKIADILLSLDPKLEENMENLDPTETNEIFRMKMRSIHGGILDNEAFDFKTRPSFDRMRKVLWEHTWEAAALKQTYFVNREYVSIGGDD